MRITVYPRTEQDIEYGLQRLHVTTGNRVVHYNAYLRREPYNDVCHVYQHDKLMRCRELKLDSPMARRITAAIMAAD